VIYNGHVGLALDATRMIHAPHTGDHVRVAAIYGSPIGYRRIVG
jgi:cell wall-associated NlpC family hydrolase